MGLMSRYWIIYGTNVTGEGQGLYRQAFDEETLELGPVERAAEGAKMGFLARAADGSRLYSAVSLEGGRGGARAYAVDAARGELTLISEQAAGGTGLCYVGLDHSGKCLLAASYGDAVVSVFPIGEDGTLEPLSFSTRHEGRGVHPKRQEAAHAHSIYTDPTNRFALVCDLGLDQIHIYRLDAEAARLEPGPMPFVRAAPGAGPRHLAFHPNGRWVYAINELNGTVTQYEWRATEGFLVEKSEAPTLPDGFDGDNTTAEVLVSQDGRFLYGSNRGHDSIAAYAIDKDTGFLERIQIVSTEGAHPRNFALSPNGRVLVAANRDSDKAAFFRVDKESGMLEYANVASEVPQPICVRFIHSIV